MDRHFYLKFFICIFASFFILFGLVWFGLQKTQVKQKKALLKARLKGSAYSQIDLLNRKLEALNHPIDTILKEIESQNNSFSNRSSNKDGLDKTKLSGKSFDNSVDSHLSQAVKSHLDPYFDSLFLNFFVFDKQNLKDPIYIQKIEEPELLEALNLNNSQRVLSLNQAYFEKIQWKEDSYFLFLLSKESYIFVGFLKKSYFRQKQKKTSYKNQLESNKRHASFQLKAESQLKEEAQFKSQAQLKTHVSLPTHSTVLFASFDKNQDRFFYNTNIKDSSKLINVFFKDSSSKYITRTLKKTQALYYLQKWQGTNLLLISKKEMSLGFFDVLIEKDTYFLLLVSLACLLLIFFLFVLYSKLSTVFKAFSFLKTAVIEYSKTGYFPEDSSKNSFLFFYRNRQEVLNEITKEDSKLKEKDMQLQELMKQEIAKLKNKYPHLIVNEDFQTDIKLFGFQNFFRTILNELLLNAVESMGAMKEQKVDISIKEEKQFLVLSLKDYGVGLKEVEKVFQIYYSTKSQLGVGLNLVQSIVIANQGQIKLIPQKEGGLLAVVHLPLSCFLKK